MVCLDALTNAVGCLDGAIQWCLRKNHREFLAAVSRGEVNVPARTANRFGDGPDDHIPARVAEPVIYFLQKIQVDDQQRQRVVVTLCAPKLERQGSLKKPVVWKTGKKVRLSAM